MSARAAQQQPATGGRARNELILLVMYTSCAAACKPCRYPPWQIRPDIVCAAMGPQAASALNLKPGKPGYVTARQTRSFPRLMQAVQAHPCTALRCVAPNHLPRQRAHALGLK